MNLEIKNCIHCKIEKKDYLSDLFGLLWYDNTTEKYNEVRTWKETKRESRTDYNFSYKVCPDCVIDLFNKSEAKRKRNSKSLIIFSFFLLIGVIINILKLYMSWWWFIIPTIVWVIWLIMILPDSYTKKQLDNYKESLNEDKYCTGIHRTLIDDYVRNETDKKRSPSYKSSKEYIDLSCLKSEWHHVESEVKNININSIDELLTYLTVSK